MAQYELRDGWTIVHKIYQTIVYLLQLFISTKAQKAYLVKKVDLCDGVTRITRVLHQQRNQPNKGVQGVEALGSVNKSSIVLLPFI